MLLVFAVCSMPPGIPCVGRDDSSERLMEQAAVNRNTEREGTDRGPNMRNRKLFLRSPPSDHFLRIWSNNLDLRNVAKSFIPSGQSWLPRIFLLAVGWALAALNRQGLKRSGWVRVARTLLLSLGKT